ncbi:MAG: C40 family peptidase [Promicromonosporaceae bacterium]|nr:C40 family peptidase [Promicromonosporaceae bacterium]
MTTFGAGAAQAAPAHHDAATSTVDLGALAAQAREALAAAPVVTVAQNAQVQVETGVAVHVTPAPVREAPAPARTATVARTATRTAARTATATAAAPAPAAPSIGAPAPASAAGSAVVAIAARYVGVPYVSGGTSPAGFDCSGFTQYVFAQLGISLPRTSSAQRYVGTVVSAADAQPGDLIWSPGHVAIYAGNGQMIDAPRPGKTIQFRAMWQSNPVFIRL